MKTNAVRTSPQYGPVAQMSVSEAAGILGENLDMIDTAAGGRKDGKFTKADLRAIAQSPNLPPRLRQAAWLVLQNAPVFNQLDRAGMFGSADGKVDIFGLAEVHADTSAMNTVLYKDELDTRWATVNTITQARPNRPPPPGRKQPATSRADAPVMPRERQVPQPSRVKILRTVRKLKEHKRAWSQDETAMFKLLNSLNPADRVGALERFGSDLDDLLAAMLKDGWSTTNSNEMGKLLATLAKDAEHFPKRASKLIERALATVVEHGGNADDDTVRAMVEQLGERAPQVLSKLTPEARAKMIGILESGYYSDDDKSAVRMIEKAGVIAACPKGVDASKVAETADFLTAQLDGWSTDESAMFDKLLALSPAERIATLKALGPRLQTVLAEMFLDGGTALPKQMGGLLAALVKDAKDHPEASGLIRQLLTTVEANTSSADDDTIRYMAAALGEDADIALSHVSQGARNQMIKTLKAGWYSDDDRAVVDILEDAQEISVDHKKPAAAKPVTIVQVLDTANVPAETRDQIVQETNDVDSDWNILNDPTLSVEDLVMLLLILIMKKMDKKIDRKGKFIKGLQLKENTTPQSGETAGSGAPSIDIETMQLKRLVDKRSQMFDTFRQIIDRYNQTAKGVIDTMGR